ncbi:hypothetical protein J2X47_003839 [Sphingomonas sp. BE270]|nr:hypothetical protein [Sphingomonas sp. BE270]
MTSSRSTWLLALTGLAMTTITEPALSQGTGEKRPKNVR